jgi:hypothetical protein
MNRIMAPFVAPTKVYVCREKARGIRGPRPLGAGMDASAFVCLAASTAPTGAWPWLPGLGTAVRAVAFLLRRAWDSQGPAAQPGPEL